MAHFFFISHALSFGLNFFRPEFPFNSNQCFPCNGIQQAFPTGLSDFYRKIRTEIFIYYLVSFIPGFMRVAPQK